jgi:cytochrome b561
MTLHNSPNEFGLLSKALHWLMALIIITLIAVGIYMADLPRDTQEQKEYAFQFISLHKSFGVLALVLIIVRLLWLRLSPAPTLPDAFAGGERKLIKGLQGLLYLLMILLPLSGYLMSNAGGYPIHFFGFGELPALIGKSKEFGEFAHEAHELMGFGMLLVVVLHAVGALKHRLKDKGGETDILKRML